MHVMGRGSGRRPLFREKTAHADSVGRLAARACLILMWNSLHAAPFGLLEDVYVARPFAARSSASRS